MSAYKKSDSPGNKMEKDPDGQGSGETINTDAVEKGRNDRPGELQTPVGATTDNTSIVEHLFGDDEAD